MRRASRSTHERLFDILDAIEQGRLAVGDLSLESFSQRRMNQLAAERAIEIISEASRHLPEPLKAQATSVPWRDVADIGNVLRHVYEKVDAKIIWSAIRKDFDVLEQAVRAMLASLPEQD